MQTSLVSREFLAQFFASHILRTLDDPEMEYLSLYYEVVLISYLVLYLYDVLAWEARYDTVNECSAHVVVLLKPLGESLCLLAKVRSPKLNILADAILKVMTVEEDKLARHDDKTFGRISVKGIEAVPEQLCQLSWVRGSRCISEDRKLYQPL